MADVAKGLRQWVVIPSFAGSNPVVRPIKFIKKNMSRYCGPRLRITRRLGNLPGLTKKVTLRLDLPGQHGKSKKKLTEYGLRLTEKQKLRFNYGLTERQLYQYIKNAKRKQGITGLILLQLLEMRLDSICFSLGFASTIIAARQMITHGNILVNNKKVTIPSFQCYPNDIIRIKTKLKMPIYETVKSIPSHVEISEDKTEGKINDYCSREAIPFTLNELLVIEYYSRR